MRRSTCMPMPVSPRQRPALAPGSASITKSASTRASATTRRAKFTTKACGYVDDRRCRPSALPPASRASSETGEMLAFAHIPTGTTANRRIDQRGFEGKVTTAFNGDRSRHRNPCVAGARLVEFTSYALASRLKGLFGDVGLDGGGDLYDQSHVCRWAEVQSGTRLLSEHY